MHRPKTLCTGGTLGTGKTGTGTTGTGKTYEAGAYTPGRNRVSLLASRGKAYVGCSGWSYTHWRGTVYDASLRPKDWFSDYARRFRTVEVNNTFYRLPEPATFKRVAGTGAGRLRVRPQGQPVRHPPPPAATARGLD